MKQKGTIQQLQGLESLVYVKSNLLDRLKNLN
jgi:hypothetical protein